MQPVLPVFPVEPEFPVLPVLPVKPVFPVLPVLPVLPVFPVLPVLPVGPMQPVGPVFPVAPVFPFTPAIPSAPVLPVAPVLPARLTVLNFFASMSVVTDPCFFASMSFCEHQRYESTLELLDSFFCANLCPFKGLEDTSADSAHLKCAAHLLKRIRFNDVSPLRNFDPRCRCVPR